MKNTGICNFADDTTLHACDTNLDELLMRLEHDAALTVGWFESNYQNLNTDKCYLIISGNKNESSWADIGNDKMWESNNVKLLGVNIDRDVKFNGHMLNMCSKANRKLTILSRMFKYLTFEKKRILVSSYFESQFKYCPLVWMFHGRQSNNRINSLHERALKMIYDDSTSSFVSLLERDKSFSVHNCDIQQLAMEIYKVAPDLASKAMSILFLRNNSMQTRSQSEILVPQINTVYVGQKFT